MSDFRKIESSSGFNKFKVIFAAVSWGTMGLFVRFIDMPSSLIACIRGFIGALFLFALVKLSKKSLDTKAINENLKYLILSGIALGFNWILIFEAYKRTSLAIASLCYYLAPVIVIVMSHFLFKEYLSFKKIVCVALALLGMVFVSGLLQGELGSGYGVIGMICGLCAGVLYATVTLLGKKIKGISAFDETIVQLLVAAIVLIPYNIITVDSNDIKLTSVSVTMVILLGMIHTGGAFGAYFSSLQHLKAQTVAIFSYLDPVVSILASIFILKESMDVLSLVGAVLILGSILFSELSSDPQRH